MATASLFIFRRFLKTCCGSKKVRSTQRSIAWSRKAGSVRSGARSENNRRARYYRLTPAGRKQLAEEEKNWERITYAVGRVLQFT